MTPDEQPRFGFCLKHRCLHIAAVCSDCHITRLNERLAEMEGVASQTEKRLHEEAGRARRWKDIAIHMHSDPGFVLGLNGDQLMEAMRVTKQSDPYFFMLYDGLLTDMVLKEEYDAAL